MFPTNATKPLLKLATYFPKLAPLLLGGMLFTYGITSWLIPPAVVFDSGFGLVVLTAMERGASFNSYFAPDPQDISRDLIKLQTWWTPGQYLVPALFRRFGFNLGQSLTLTNCFFNALGLLGCWLLYRALGFSRAIVTLSCIATGASRMLALSFGNYHGGEVLLFGIFGLTAWLFLKCRALHWRQLPLLALLLLLGTLGKLSFGICGLALLMTLFLLHWKSQASPAYKLIAVSALKLAAVWCLYYAILSISFLSKGETPGTTFTAYQPPYKALLFSLPAPISGAFSFRALLDSMFRYLHLPTPYKEPFVPEATWLLIVLTIFSVWLLIKAFRAGTVTYQTTLVSFFTVYVGGLSWLLISGAAVSYEDRHYRPAGLILVPGVIAFLLSHGKRWLNFSLAGLLICCCFYGFLSFFVRAKVNNAFAVGREGFTQIRLSNPAISVLQRIDSELPSGNNLIFVTAPELCLEVKRQRTMFAFLEALPIEEPNSGPYPLGQYRGKVDHLVLVIPNDLRQKGRAEVICRSFIDYHEAWHISETAETTFYYQGNLSQTQWQELVTKPIKK